MIKIQLKTIEMHDLWRAHYRMICNAKTPLEKLLLEHNKEFVEKFSTLMDKANKKDNFSNKKSTYKVSFSSLEACAFHTIWTSNKMEEGCGSTILKVLAEIDHAHVSATIIDPKRII